MNYYCYCNNKLILIQHSTYQCYDSHRGVSDDCQEPEHATGPVPDDEGNEGRPASVADAAGYHGEVPGWFIIGHGISRPGIGLIRN